MQALKKLMKFANMVKMQSLESKGIFNTNEHNAAIRRRVLQGKTTEVMHPTSMRSMTKGADGTYASGEIKPGNSGNADHYEEVTSSAIQDVKYDPSSHICKVKFTSGDTWYDFMMTPAEFENFMNSDSKGQYVQNIMRKQNLMPGYVRTTKASLANGSN